jgi:hypothetical protein
MSEQGTPITYPVSVFSRNTYALPNEDSQNAAAATWESGGQMPVTVSVLCISRDGSSPSTQSTRNIQIPHNPLSGGSYAFLPSPVHATRTPQRGWQISDCWIEGEGGEEIHLVVLCKRISRAAPLYSAPRVYAAPPGVWSLSTCWIEGEGGDEIKVVFSCLRTDLHGGSPVHQYT